MDEHARSRAKAINREQLLHLLAEASEFEHSLLCCYLYAAFSLKDSADDLTETQLPIVRGWHESIMSVAIEEMSHLALVANLTVAIGGRPHFNRPNLPVSPGYHPSGIVIELAPFDMETLDHFIFLERPSDAPLADAPSFVPDAEYERGSRAGAALMPSAHDYGTIAEFYERIRNAFVSLSAEIGEKRLFVGEADCQVGPNVASLDGLTMITNLASAVAAIDTIVVQGEGATAASDDSHFARFCGIKKEYEAQLKAHPSFTPAYPSARNPVMREPVASSGRTHIDEPHAAAVLDLANALYNHMLRLLTQAYGRPRAVERQKLLISAAMETMHMLARVSVHLARLPARRDTSGVNAGVTFAMLRATEPLLENDMELVLIAERFDELADGMKSVGRDMRRVGDSSDSLKRLAERFRAARATAS